MPIDMPKFTVHGQLSDFCFAVRQGRHRRLARPSLGGRAS